MLHLFPRFTDDFDSTPYAAELRRLGVPYRLFGRGVSLRYRSAAGLLFSVYPRLFLFALRGALQSLLLSRPAPGAAIIGTDVEALIFGLLRLLLRRRTLIVFETFIVTPRKARLADALYRRYFAFIAARVDIAICHSRAEAEHYTSMFAGAKARFAVVPFGTTVNGRERLVMEAARLAGAGRAIVTAGRSGRDYPTLAKAIEGLPCRLQIICDIAAPVEALPATPQITILRDRFDQAYLRTLAEALFVVVPLAVDDVSAGQMVLLQAAALGRAVIITRTATTSDYATDGEDALLVDRGDAGQMRAAVRRLLADAVLRDRLGANAAARFDRQHSTEAYVRNLVGVIGRNEGLLS
jgi:glycosyltransferase involved in cell wall biosynthesis